VAAHQSPRFDINAEVVFRLGEELITDEVQALVELVKNSYDADASWVKVTIDTNGLNQNSESYPEAKGLIRVEDNGDGMSREVIQEGWLTLANSPKRLQKSKGLVSRRGRTPIGDKGLGRLGVQRLANNVEIFTRQAGAKEEIYVAYSWSDFRNTAQLSQVPLTFKELVPSSRNQGTTLLLSDLKNPETWRGESKTSELQRNLSAMISPFREVRDFAVYLELDGKTLELSEIAQQVRESAQQHYRFDFDGTTFQVKGRARLSLLEPGSLEDRQLLKSLYKLDEGEALFTYLSKKATRKRPQYVKRSTIKGWFVEFGFERKLNELDKVRRIPASKDVCNPGPFHGEVDQISLERSDDRNHALDRLSTYRQLVKDLAGIRVYRDGFGIRVGEDWLGLGKQWTQGSSYYTLKPGNVLGYVALTAKDNAVLVETTSREGFQKTPHYENFYKLMTEFVRFAGNIQEFLRRGTLDFLGGQRDLKANSDPGESAKDITRRIQEVASALGEHGDRLDEHASKLRSVANDADATLTYVRGLVGGSGETDSGIQKTVARLETSLPEVSSAVINTERFLGEIRVHLQKASDLKMLRDSLDRRWDDVQEVLSSLYESISLGLTAEILTHEIHNIADGLAKRSADLLRIPPHENIRRSVVVSYAEQVRSSVTAMRKQLAHLTPSLKYLREHKVRVDLVAFLGELAEFHNERLSNNSIAVQIRPGSTGSIYLNFNRGKLTQIFDNLIINADYWLREAIRTAQITSGVITITTGDRLVHVTDNGFGIDRAVEETLFDPFVTLKDRNEGRGLGLFVVQQLLDSENCTVSLLLERNALGRRCIFELDFTGALSG
jgi:signal transduction histidine kinase